MNRTRLTTIAPEVYRQRLLVEGYFAIPVDRDTIRAYFDGLTGVLGLRTYGEPIVHRTSGQAREINEGAAAGRGGDCCVRSWVRDQRIKHAHVRTLSSSPDSLIGGGSQ